MILAIPAESNSMQSPLCPSFGRAPYFLLYDTDLFTTQFIANPAAKATGGAGIQAAQAVVDAKAEFVLCPRCGENAAQVLKEANIQIFHAQNSDLQENIQLFMEGKLDILRDIHPGMHGHG